MNTYGTETAVTAELATGSVSNLLHLDDQLTAAVKELAEAWGGYVYGPQPTPTDKGASLIPPSDRIERIAAHLELTIGQIREIAIDIRRRQ